MFSFKSVPASSAKVPYHLAGFTDVAGKSTNAYHRHMQQISGIEYPGGRPFLPVALGAAGIGALAYGAKQLWNRRKKKQQTGGRRIKKKRKKRRRVK